MPSTARFARSRLESSSSTIKMSTGASVIAWPLKYPPPIGGDQRRDGRPNRISISLSQIGAVGSRRGLIRNPGRVCALGGEGAGASPMRDAPANVRPRSAGHQAAVQSASAAGLQPRARNSCEVAALTPPALRLMARTFRRIRPAWSSLRDCGSLRRRWLHRRGCEEVCAGRALSFAFSAIRLGDLQWPTDGRAAERDIAVVA